MARLEEVVELFLARKAKFSDLRKALQKKPTASFLVEEKSDFVKMQEKLQQDSRGTSVESINLCRKEVDCQSVRGWSGYSETDIICVIENGKLIAVLGEHSYFHAAPYDSNGHKVEIFEGEFAFSPLTEEDLSCFQVTHKSDYLRVYEDYGEIVAIAVREYKKSAGASIWHEGNEKDITRVHLRTSAKHPAIAKAINNRLAKSSYSAEFYEGLGQCEAVLYTDFAWLHKAWKFAKGLKSTLNDTFFTFFPYGIMRKSFHVEFCESGKKAIYLRLDDNRLNESVVKQFNAPHSWQGDWLKIEEFNWSEEFTIELDEFIIQQLQD